MEEKLRAWKSREYLFLNYPQEVVILSSYYGKKKNGGYTVEAKLPDTTLIEYRDESPGVPRDLGTIH